MRRPVFSRRFARLTTLLALGALMGGCSTNDLRGDDVSADPMRPDKQPDPYTEQQYRDAQERERQRQSAAVSAKSTVKPKH